MAGKRVKNSRKCLEKGIIKDAKRHLFTKQNLFEFINNLV